MACLLIAHLGHRASRTFVPRQYTLTLVVDASPEHQIVATRVRSTPAGLDCSAPPYPKTCTMRVNYGTSVRLDATGTFVNINWTGCTVAAGNANRCSLGVTGNRTVRTSSIALL